MTGRESTDWLPTLARFRCFKSAKGCLVESYEYIVGGVLWAVGFSAYFAFKIVRRLRRRRQPFDAS